MADKRQASLFLDDEVADTGGAALREYDSRRCLICGGRRPPFGFGPPLTIRGVWACSEHRAEVDRRVGSPHGAGTGLETATKESKGSGRIK